MKDIIKYFKNYKIKAILAPVFKMLEAGFELVIPLVMAAIIDNGINNNDKPYIYKMAGVMFLLGVLGLISAVTAQYFSAKTAMGFAKELRGDLFRHITKLSYTELDEIGVSTLITRMTSDVNQIQTGVNMFLRLFMRSPFIVFGAMIMAFVVNVKAAMVFIVTIPLLALVVFGIMLISIPLHKKVQEGLDKVTLVTRENLAGARVIRAFGRESEEMQTFYNASESLTKGQLTAGKVSSFLNPLTYAIINLSIIFIIWKGAGQVNSGILKQGEVYALVNYMSQILIELIKLANLIIIETKTIACARRVSTILNYKSSQEYRTSPAAESGNSHIVEFKNVSLVYKGAKEASLSNISFYADRGEVIGIIGGTGSGKSTLINLISRFYDCTEGEVSINGTNVRYYPKNQLISLIGIVPQKAVLFRGSIRDNIKWGKREAEDAEINEALTIAQAKEFVDDKGGIDYKLNQGAKNLSGGQKQRITIARAIVKKPEILILDDSSSALDYVTDLHLRQAIRSKNNDMTTFIVSQRTASIIDADRILVLDDGELVGIGTHTELMDCCDIYREIYYSQNKGEDKEVPCYE